MSDVFLKIKKRLWIKAFVKSGIFALSLATLTSSAIILMQKLTTNSINLLQSLLFGAVALLFGFAVLFVILLPRDKHIAKRLDKDFSLGEKTQTMLEYKNDEAEMSRIQREDTNNRLLSIFPRAFKERRILLHIIAPILAITILLPAILVPLKAVTPTPDTEIEPEYNATAWQKTAVKELIAYVEASNLEAVPKAEVLLSLNELLAFLDTTTTASELQAYVVGIIVSINTSVDNVNTYNEIAVALVEAESQLVKELAAAIGTLQPLTVKGELDFIKSTLLKEISKDELNAFSTALSTAILTVSPVEGDVLLPALIKFAEEYARISNEMDSYTDTWVNNNVTGANDTLYNSISLELFTQFENDAVRKYAIRRLVEIFSIPDEMVPEDVKISLGTNGGDYEYGEDDKDSTLNSGGYGDAEQIFGSNDTVYDPETNTHVSYGAILNAYYAKVKEQLMAGGTSESLSEFIDAYFSSLYDGSKKD